MAEQRIVPRLSEWPRRRRARAHRHGNPRRGRGRACRAGARADGDRAADALGARAASSTAISTCCADTSRRLASPASRSSAITSTTIGAACRRRWACSTCSIRRPASRSRSSTPPDSPTCAPAPSPRSARSIWRGNRAGCWGTSARAAPRTGTCGCSTRCSTSTKSACIRAGRRAATASPHACRATSASPSSQPTTGNRACAAPTSSSRRRGSPQPEPLLETAWIKRGAFVVPYGTMSAVELSLTDIMDKLVVDDWGQCKAGQFGSLRAHVDAGKLSAATLHAELGEIVAGRKPGPRARRRDDAVLAPRPVAVRHRARVTRCCRRRSGWASASACAMREPTNVAMLIAETMLIANARMYAVNAAVAAAWRTLLEWVIARAGVAAKSSTIPRRNRCRRCGRGPMPRCVFMCGYPFATRADRSRAFSPRPFRRRARYGDAPVYCTDIVVRADSPMRGLDDAFGRRFAFTTEDSQSGYQAPRRLLAPFARRPRRHAVRARSRSVANAAPRRRGGPVGRTPTRARSTAISTTCCASTSLRSPRSLRVLASTPPTPIPPLVAAAATAARRSRAGLARRCWRWPTPTNLAAVRADAAAAQIRRPSARRTMRSCAQDARATDATGYAADRRRHELTPLRAAGRMDSSPHAAPTQSLPEPPMSLPTRCPDRRCRSPPSSSPRCQPRVRSASARRTSPSSSSSPRSTRRRSKPRESRSSARSTSAAR